MWHAHCWHEDCLSLSGPVAGSSDENSSLITVNALTLLALRSAEAVNIMTKARLGAGQVSEWRSWG